jgi:tryptophan synthase beta subunit
MKQINAVVLAIILSAHSLYAGADGPAIGPNGGQVRDTGKYHLELVVKDTALTVYVTGNKDAKVATKGATGSATVLAGKSTSNVKLEPSGENALAGSGSFQAAPDMKVVVSVTLPGQSPLQARFTPLESPKSSARATAK